MSSLSTSSSPASSQDVPHDDNASSTSEAPEQVEPTFQDIVENRNSLPINIDSAVRFMLISGLPVKWGPKSIADQFASKVLRSKDVFIFAQKVKLEIEFLQHDQNSSFSILSLCDGALNAAIGATSWVSQHIKYSDLKVHVTDLSCGAPIKGEDIYLIYEAFQRKHGIRPTFHPLDLRTVNPNHAPEEKATEASTVASLTPNLVVVSWILVEKFVSEHKRVRSDAYRNAFIDWILESFQNSFIMFLEGVDEPLKVIEKKVDSFRVIKLHKYFRINPDDKKSRRAMIVKPIVKA